MYIYIARLYRRGTLIIQWRGLNYTEVGLRLGTSIIQRRDTDYTQEGP